MTVVTYHPEVMMIFVVQTLLHDEENQVRGFSYVFDCTGLTLAHLSIWTPAECSRVLSICEKNLPMRHKDINLVNLPFPMWAVFEFCKTLLSDKIRRRFSVINSIEKLKTKMGTGEVSKNIFSITFQRIYLSFLSCSSDILPSEYGGDTSLDQMTGAWAEALRDHRDILLGKNSLKGMDHESCNIFFQDSILWLLRRHR